MGPSRLRFCSRRRCPYSSVRNSSLRAMRTLLSRADGEAAAGGGKARRLEDAVAEIGFGDGAQAGDGAGFGQAPRSRPAVMCVQWIRHQRASRLMLSSSHCTGRAPDQATQSSTSRACSAACMWMGPAAHRSTSARSSDASTARSECGAMPRVAPSSRSTWRRLDVQQAPEAVEVEQEARLSRRGRLAAAAAVGIEGRQQRKSDAARFRGRHDAAAGLRRVGIMRAVRARCAGSGTRRRW